MIYHNIIQLPFSDVNVISPYGKIKARVIGGKEEKKPTGNATTISQ
jgi:hypothetical protein